MAETGPGAGRFWELLGGGDLGLACSWALDVLGLGLRHKHSPGPLASGLVTMNVASPRKWWVMGIRQGKNDQREVREYGGKTSGPRIRYLFLPAIIWAHTSALQTTPEFMSHVCRADLV